MSNVSQGAAFEKEVEQILQLKGYKVSRNNLINGTQIDLLATRNDPLENVSLVVECADRDSSIGVDLVKEKSAVLLSLQGSGSIYRLMFVSRNGFSAEAKAFAKAYANILLLTLTELENLLVDLTPYVTGYLHNYSHALGMFKEAKLIQNYVGLSARDLRNSPILSLENHIRKWLSDENNNLLFLLGDYGAGKTSFSRHLAYQLLDEKYVKRSRQHLTPILINLRESRGKLDLRRVVTDSLVGSYGVDLQSFAAFERLCSTGNILLLLDGFDEMSDRCDSQTLVDSFNQIYLFAALNAKIILTCRANFFRSHSDVIDLLQRFSITIPVESQNKLLEVSLKDQGEILYVDKLSEAQIREFVAKRFGNKSSEVLSTIKKIHDLSDLSTRPVLLDMIMSTLPALQNSKRRINSAALYEHYTDRWTNRDQWRVNLPLRVRQQFCEILAWEMYCANVDEISNDFLETCMVRTLQSMARSEDQLEQFKNDIQTCSFLVRAGAKNGFRFAHKSFLEFFAARKIVADLSAGAAIQKSDVKKLLEKKPDMLVEAPFTFHESESMSRALSLRYVREVLNDRFRSTPLFQSMQEVEVGTRWHAISSDASVRSHLESEIRALFVKRWAKSFSNDISISEEIATFASEYLSNSTVAFESLIAKISSPSSIAVLCDVLRLGNSTEWAQQNVKAVKNYMIAGADERLRLACAAALTRVPDTVSLEFLKEARASLPQESWSYILFEIASQGKQHEELLSKIIQTEKLGPVDQVICIYGLEGKLPEDEKNEKMATLVAQLLRSQDERERSLASQVCGSLPPQRRIAVLVEAVREVDSKAIKKELLTILQDFADPNDWRLFRTLALAEHDSQVRAILQKIEQILRDMFSREENRISWDRVKGKRAIRENVWGMGKNKAGVPVTASSGTPSSDTPPSTPVLL